MKHIYPNYYSKFECLAGACRHTCCAGWEIDIDSESLERFKKHKDIMAYVDQTAETPCFRLTANDICPFLNSDGLCRMFTEYGESMLCDICADHPRFMNYLSDRVETGLGMCCEAAADLILNSPEKFVLIEEDDGLQAALSEDETDILSVRNDVFACLSDRRYTVSQRIENILKKAQCLPFNFTVKRAYELLAPLERMDPEWDSIIAVLSDTDEPVKITYDSATEHMLENLAYYFFYRHLLPAAEDGELIGRLKLCAFLWYTAVLLILSNGITKASDICRRLSCEIEYSDENIERLIEAMDLDGSEVLHE